MLFLSIRHRVHRSATANWQISYWLSRSRRTQYRLPARATTGLGEAFVPIECRDFSGKITRSLPVRRGVARLVPLASCVPMILKQCGPAKIQKCTRTVTTAWILKIYIIMIFTVKMLPMKYDFSNDKQQYIVTCRYLLVLAQREIFVCSKFDLFVICDSKLRTISTYPYGQRTYRRYYVEVVRRPLPLVCSNIRISTDTR